jgi:hypothetical protein
VYQQLWGYKVEEKLYVGVREQKRLNTAVLDNIKVVTEMLHGFPLSAFSGLNVFISS